KGREESRCPGRPLAADFLRRHGPAQLLVLVFASPRKSLQHERPACRRGRTKIDASSLAARFIASGLTRSAPVGSTSAYPEPRKAVAHRARRLLQSFCASVGV